MILFIKGRNNFWQVTGGAKTFGSGASLFYFLPLGIIENFMGALSSGVETYCLQFHQGHIPLMPLYCTVYTPLTKIFLSIDARHTPIMWFKISYFIHFSHFKFVNVMFGLWIIFGVAFKIKAVLLKYYLKWLFALVFKLPTIISMQHI